VVLVALDAHELGPVEPGVHGGLSVAEHRAPVVADDGVAERPTHASRAAGFPCLDRGIAHLNGQEFQELGRLHDAFGDFVVTLAHFGGRVSMGGVEHQLARVETGQRGLEPRAQALHQAAVDGHHVQ